MEWLAKENNVGLNAVAHALDERSLFQHRRAIVASNIAELSSSLKATTFEISKSPKAKNVFIFTGQGAQWPSMGHDLLRYPVYAQSIRRSATIIKELGASWDLEDELAYHSTDCNIHDSSYAQPITTAVQIALVDLLRSWKILAEAVVGHSSGEIGAAYAAQLICQSSALKVAYHRGSLGQLAFLKTSRAGAMLAIGLGREDVERRISLLGLSDEAFIACINSPKSTTVSGNSLALDTIQRTVKADGTFARQLKVNTAYHSPHMESVRDEYRCLLSDIKHVATSQEITFYSTVSSRQKATIHSSEYWVENLVSPVRFSDTILHILDDLSSVEQINFIEIGPHSALQGPIRQILDNAPSFQQRRSKYIPTLIRGQSGIQTMLKASASLFENGCKPKVPPSVNLHRGSLRVPLPSYHWSRKPYWHEPRISRDYRLRSWRPHELCGIRVLTSPEDEPTWRVLLGQNSLPWLADHVIDGFAVFPATAYLAMVVEALKQWKRYQNHIPSLRKVQFKRALNIPAGEERVELVLRLRDLNDFSANFRIWSVVDDQWHEHCEGIAAMSSNHSGLSGLNLVSKRIDICSPREKMNEITSRCIESVSPGAFYGLLSERGNQYGPAFCLITRTQVCQSEARVSVTVPHTSYLTDRKPSFPTYTLHPVIFDTLLQIPVYLFARTVSAYSIMPITFGEIEVLPQLNTTPGQDFQVYCQVRNVSKNTCWFDITAFQEDGMGELQPVIQCRNGELRATGDPPPAPIIPSKETVFNMKWEVDPASLTSSDIQSIERSAVMEVELQEAKMYRLLATAERFIGDAIYEVQRLHRVPTEGHLALAYDTMLQQVDKHRLSDQRSLDVDGSNSMDLGVEGELVDRIGPCLGSILGNQADMLSALLDDNLLYRIYQEDSTSRCNAYLIKYLQHLTFKYPNLRILEVGAGTGGTTLPLFEALAPDGRPFYDCYHYTDISPGFFDQARTKLAKWVDIINFSIFDIEIDPIVQGFPKHSYDLIIASNVMHATRNIQTTLGNLHKLLAPSGSLAFIELIKNNALYMMTVGLLPGWWTGKLASSFPNLAYPLAMGCYF